MSIQSLKNRIKVLGHTDESPNWVSKNNLSFDAFECINQLKDSKKQFIESHTKLKDFKKKGHFQINATEVARVLKCAVPTLISTSAYSSELKKYLDEVNADLEKIKDKKINRHLNTLSAGTKQRKKDEIRIELQIVKMQFESLKKKNATAQAQLIVDALSLPVKQKLGIDT